MLRKTQRTSLAAISDPDRTEMHRDLVTSSIVTLNRESRMRFEVAARLASEKRHRERERDRPPNFIVARTRRTGRDNAEWLIIASSLFSFSPFFFFSRSRSYKYYTTD